MIDLFLLGAVLRMTAPILLAGVGGLINDRAGVTNITIEGTMLISAFFSVACSYFTGSWILGTLAGVAAGMAVSVLFHGATALLGGDELVVGFSLNILLDGLSIFLLKQIFHQSGSLFSERIVGVPLIQCPLLADVPILGDILNGQTWIVYFAFFSALVSYVILYKAPAGLRIRACGENPQAAATAGIHVRRVRFFCNLVSGALCGLSGVQISLGFLSLFTQGMTVGKGFIALGSVIFSKGNPLRLMAITVVFGLAEAVSNKVQLLKLPSELVLMLPYVVVVLLTLICFDRTKTAKKTDSN